MFAQSDAAAHFLLIHSPLVTRATWIGLASSLKTAGYGVTAVALNNNVAEGEAYYEHHISLVEPALVGLEGQKLVGVAHSGAGNLLALMNPEQISAHVFLDAIFPVAQASRFSLFDDVAVVQQWQALAERHAGVLPQSTLVRLGEQVDAVEARAALVAGIADVPIALYEESIPVHSAWPVARGGLYIQWTQSYTQDAARARDAGFDVRAIEGSHFEMLEAPDKIARMLIEFALVSR